MTSLVRDTIKRYFTIRELVHKDLLSRYSEEALWNSLDDVLLEALYWIRTTYGKPITINSGDLQNCGLRYNQNSLSAHMLGKALDLHASDLNALLEVCKRCPYLTEIEDPAVTLPKKYIHVSVRHTGMEEIKIFKP